MLELQNRTRNVISAIKNGSNTAGIFMEENSKNNAHYFIAENTITITGARDGIKSMYVFNPVIE
ncbi:MAG: hypothetical protein IPP71_23475 [Bacteroidetes bacterium]|nr:hypothetical protein [Bacteroidota bacterium]